MTTATPTAAPEPTTTGDPSRRGSLLAAVAVAEWTKLRSERSAFAALGAGHEILDRRPRGPSVADPTGRRAVFGAGAFLTIVGLRDLALGPAVRRSAGATATLVALGFIAGLLAQALPSPWND